MDIYLLIITLALAWFWLDCIGKREIAIEKGTMLAERCQLQLLDETVACTKIWIGRNQRGHSQWVRLYEFEVSANGADRLNCHLQLIGKELQTWHIPPYLQVVH